MTEDNPITPFDRARPLGQSRGVSHSDFASISRVGFEVGFQAGLTAAERYLEDRSCEAGMTPVGEALDEARGAMRTLEWSQEPAARPILTLGAGAQLIAGPFLIYRQIPKGFARAAKPPRFKHPTYEAAEAEAKRLLALHPESTFVILQEIALVKGAVQA